MEISEAVKILNENHHWFGSPNKKYKWAVWMDVKHCCGATITNRLRAKFANDDDVAENDNQYLQVYDAIAVAEKYKRDGHPVDCECER